MAHIWLRGQDSNLRSRDNDSREFPFLHPAITQGPTGGMTTVGVCVLSVVTGL